MAGISGSEALKVWAPCRVEAPCPQQGGGSEATPLLSWTRGSGYFRYHVCAVDIGVDIPLGDQQGHSEPGIMATRTGARPCRRLTAQESSGLASLGARSPLVWITLSQGTGTDLMAPGGEGPVTEGSQSVAAS
jgi:hypothetical protein